MPKRGLRGNGWIFNNLLAGTGSADVNISTSTCVGGVTGFANLYTTNQDVICRNLTITSEFVPVFTSVTSTTKKIYVSGTLTIGQNGGIVADGTVPNGGAPALTTPGQGYVCSCCTYPPYAPPYHSSGILGNLGGSGSGGAAGGTGLPGQQGMPGIISETFVFWGGSGGSGAALSSISGGSGGSAFPQFQLTSWCDPSVWQQAMFYGMWNDNLDGGTTPTNLSPFYLNGGSGGGGSAGTGGGGGAGGGVLWICASEIILSGTNSVISANGQNASYGGGGGGGLIILVTGRLVFETSTASITALGGASSEGTAGAPGRILVFSNELVGQFTTGTLTQSTYQAAAVAYNA